MVDGFKRYLLFPEIIGATANILAVQTIKVRS
jgi:hypothetical protein